MTARLSRTELAMLARSSSVRAVVVALMLMIALSFTIAWSDARRTLTETLSVQAAERARWLDQDPKNSHAGAHHEEMTVQADFAAGRTRPGDRSLCRPHDACQGAPL